MSNLLSYVDYDFDSLVTQLQDRIKLRDSWKDVYRSSTGQMLIELLAYVLNLGLYYTERRAEESTLSTAQLLSSVKNLVALLNYEPKRKTSATGTLTFSIPAPLGVIVFVPKYTECESTNGVKFLTNEDSAIQKGQTSVTSKSIQGELVEVSISSSGVASQECTINSTDVEDSADSTNPTLQVLVDGVLWTKVSSFIYSETTSKHYRVLNDPEGTVTIQFGDNINGLSPSSGSTILIRYVKSLGVDGNVTGTGVITTINSVLYDETGTVVSSISVTNTGSFLGGDAEEDIEEIRYEAPRVFKTGQRAVSRTDFMAILDNYSGVASSNVWGENEEAELAGIAADPTMLNKVKICLVLQSWELPDATFKATLSEYLQGISMLTVKYEFADPTFLLVVPTVKIVVATGYSQSQVQSDVEEALADEFELGTSKLGTTTKYSRVMGDLDAISGVAYINAVLEIKKALTAGYNSGYDYGCVLDATEILPGSARLFVDDVFVTSDTDNGDGTGTFSSAGSYTLSGTINYSTGIVLLNVSPSPASSIYIRYQQDEERNIVPTFRQICKLEEVDVTSVVMES